MHTIAREFVTEELAEAVETLNRILFREYGSDYAYTIVAHGRLVAASNARLGYQSPILAAPLPEP